MHHPRLLEWVGAPESARLLSRLPAEWLQVMNRRDTLHAALQLQRDASLMSSNLMVQSHYTRCPPRCCAPCLAGSSSLRERSTTLRRFPACFGCRLIWQLWAFGNPWLVWMDPVWTLTPEPGVPGFCLMSSAAIRLVVSQSSRTAYLYRFMLDLVVG